MDKFICWLPIYFDGLAETRKYAICLVELDVTKEGYKILASLDIETDIDGDFTCMKFDDDRKKSFYSLKSVDVLKQMFVLSNDNNGVCAYDGNKEEK